MGNTADTAVTVKNVVLCKSATFEVIWYAQHTTHILGALFLHSGAECEISPSNILTPLTGVWKSHMAARFLYTYIYIYRICIFKAFVTNTFGIDSDVLCFKLQNRNDLKMKKTKPKKTKTKVFPFATKTSFFHNNMDYIDYTSWISHLLPKVSAQITGEKSGHSAGITRAEEAKVISNQKVLQARLILSRS